MRKLLLVIISALLLAFSAYIVWYGLELGTSQISSITTIQQKNASLDNKIQSASRLKNTEYPQNITLLESAYKNVMREKEDYEQLIEMGVDENGQTLSKIQEYEMERIWVIVGNYAKKQGVDLKIDVTSNNSISKTYDLNFTVIGGYIQTTDFLYEIERDSTLVFKIENFKMVPGTTTEELVTTFTCKDIKLKINDSDMTNVQETTDTNTSTDNKTTNPNSAS